MGGRFCVGVKNQRMLEEGNPMSLPPEGKPLDTAASVPRTARWTQRLGAVHSRVTEKEQGNEASQA